MEPKITFREWCMQHSIDTYCLTKHATQYLDVNVVREVSSTRMDWDDYIKELRTNAPFVARNVFYFVILENGYAVGHNENLVKDGLSQL